MQFAISVRSGVAQSASKQRRENLDPSDESFAGVKQLVKAYREENGLAPTRSSVGRAASHARA